LQEALDKPSLCEELDPHQASRESKVEYYVSTIKEKIPVSEGEENEKINNFQNKGREKETIKQRDQRQAIPLRSILKKGTICTRAKHVRFLEVDEASRDTKERGHGRGQGFLGGCCRGCGQDVLSCSYDFPNRFSNNFAHN
jgi:hypothetical protein